MRKVQQAPTLERKVYLFESKAEAERVISGYANVYGILDEVGDIVEPGAFKRSIANDSIRPLLWQHDAWSLIGDGTFSEDEKGLALVEGKLYEGVQQAEEAYAIAKQARFKLGLSVGFSIAKGGAYTDDDGNRHITEAKLYETSIVTWPANLDSRIEDVKALTAEAKTFAEVVDEAIALVPDEPSDEDREKAAALLAAIPEPVVECEPEIDVTSLLAEADAASASAALV